MIFQVAFGAIALTVHESHEKVLNFTFPISVQSYGMMIPRPKELSRLYLFIAPFSLDVSIVMIFISLYFLFSLINITSIIVINLLFFGLFNTDVALSYIYNCLDRTIILRSALSQPIS